MQVVEMTDTVAASREAFAKRIADRIRELHRGTNIQWGMHFNGTQNLVDNLATRYKLVGCNHRKRAVFGLQITVGEYQGRLYGLIYDDNLKMISKNMIREPELLTSLKG